MIISSSDWICDTLIRSKFCKKNGTLQGEGFSIVAIQCSLIEFLAATYWGRNYRFVIKNAPPLNKYEYSKSAEIFCGFLSTQEPFASVFTSEIAQDFYASVRCGLLHEPRTKNGCTIRAMGDSIVDASRKIVFRDNFQDAILDFVTWYGEMLPDNPTLQAAFIRKFDSLGS